MILRHKWNQVHFLQLFHHATIGVVWYVGDVLCLKGHCAVDSDSAKSLLAESVTNVLWLPCLKGHFAVNSDCTRSLLA